MAAAAAATTTTTTTTSGASSMDGSITSSPRPRSNQSIEELRHMIMCVRMELESTRAAARTQSDVHKAKVEQLEQLLRAALRERDDALHKLLELQSSVVCSSSAASFIADSPLDSFNDQSDWFSFPTAFDDDHLLTVTGQRESVPPVSGLDVVHYSGFEEAMMLPGSDHHPAGGLFDSSSCLQNGSALASILTPLEQRSSRNKADPDAEMNLMLKNLPERGKLLQAVMQAGPLLHTLLLAGPLPQWHHPPPGLDAFQFPSLSGSFEQQHKSCLSSDGGTRNESLDCYNQRKRRLVQNSSPGHAQAC